MNKFKQQAKEAAFNTTVIDANGHYTGADEESFIKGAEWGYRRALADASKIVYEQEDVYIYHMETAEEPFFSQYNFARGATQCIARGIIALRKKLE